MRKVLACLAVLLGLCLGTPGLSQAQTVARVWVATNGDDANDCSYATPCKSFGAAEGKVREGGEINCLDSASYGVIVIIKSLTIDCSAHRGLISVTASTQSTINGIRIQAPNDAEVVIRGIDISGYGAGYVGITANSAGRVTLDDIKVSGMLTTGIALYANIAPTRVVILNTKVIDNPGGGILAHGGASNLLTVSMKNVDAVHNVYGMRMEDNVQAVIERSSLNDNLNNGLLVYAPTTTSIAWASDSAFSNNGVNGIATSGGPANVRLVNSTVVGNVNGINTSGGGRVLSTSPGTNAIYGNQNMNSTGGSLVLQ